MSCYFVKGKGWRYDFTFQGKRYTETWFKTKKEAVLAETKRRQEVNNPQPLMETPIDMGFLDLINRRLDHVKAYNSAAYYRDYCNTAKYWVAHWGNLKCREISAEMIENFVLSRREVSPITANKEIRFLKATFNFGKKKKLIFDNPVDDIDFFPVEKNIKYVPPVEDINKVLQAANQDSRDYLITICDTIGRIGEINQLCWDDVQLADRFVVLYTRKKKGGHRTPRKVPMTQQLYEVMSRRYENRNPDLPWVFWHRFFDRKRRTWKEGPYEYRRRLLPSLCRKAGVREFTFHALRHAGASILEKNHVPIGSIQKILGHENRTTTEIYLHCLGGAELEAMRVLESVRSFSHTDSHTK